MFVFNSKSLREPSKIKFSKIDFSKKSLDDYLLLIRYGSKFGFDFDTPIGGLRQPSSYNNSWVEFYGNNRLGMIFEKINRTNPMPNEINKGIEKILKN